MKEDYLTTDELLTVREAERLLEDAAQGTDTIARRSFKTISSLCKACITYYSVVSDNRWSAECAPDKSRAAAAQNAASEHSE